jgi:hypothetical protein
MGVDLLEHVIAVAAGVLVAAPGIDGIASGGEAGLADGLAEREIGIARMGAQFDEEFGCQGAGQPGGERQMAAPGLGRLQGEGGKLRRFQQTVCEAIHAVFLTLRWMLFMGMPISPPATLVDSDFFKDTG